MASELKGIEIFNFKSYTEKQYIHFSDLSVLLGANSSGKSTALQALLVMKQTMECNSSDEELLLSGKYVTLGDFDDVISDPEKNFFSLGVILAETEKSENIIEDDVFKITWFFKRAEDQMSAILSGVEVVYENLLLKFKRTASLIYHMYINGIRVPFSVKINNLLIKDYIIHYDVELNNNAAEFLNEMSKVLWTKKVTTLQLDKPIFVDGIDEFYFRVMNRFRPKNEEQNTVTLEDNRMAERVSDLIETFGELEIPEYETVLRLIPQEVGKQMLKIALKDIDDISKIESLVLKYEKYIEKYKGEMHDIDGFEGIYELQGDLFRIYDKDDGKRDVYTQLKLALDFYKTFLGSILSKVFFVGPIREMPKGLYSIGFETIPKYVGPTGSYFASVLLHENKKRREYILPDRTEKCTLSEALAVWMIHLNVASAVNVDKKNSFGFSVSVENMEQAKSDIMNVGIGTSQVLPVLISVLLSEPDEILVFEQPELHLHPYSQSHLADMFTEFCKHGRKIILETHSEYFLLRLRYNIVKEKFSQNAVAVNFFQNMGGTKVEYANISGFGNIDYPEDFRDETQELLNAILEASLERKGLS